MVRARACESVRRVVEKQSTEDSIQSALQVLEKGRRAPILHTAACPDTHVAQHRHDTIETRDVGLRDGSRIPTAYTS